MTSVTEIVTLPAQPDQQEKALHARAMSGAPLAWREEHHQLQEALGNSLKREAAKDRTIAHLQTACALLFAAFALACVVAGVYGREALHYAQRAGVGGV